MANEIALTPTADEQGLLDLAPDTRQQIYRYLLLDHRHNTIPVFLASNSTFNHDSFAISPRPLSAQLLRSCHQILNESYPILYIENKFMLYLDNNIASPRIIPLSLTKGNVCELQSVTISIQSVHLLEDDLQILLSALPFLRVFGIDGNLLRTIDFYRPLECGSETAMQRCVDQSVGLLLSAFGGKEVFRRFMIQNPHLTVEYTFGIAVDLI